MREAGAMKEKLVVCAWAGLDSFPRIAKTYDSVRAFD
jgi:hypothetical protein